MLQYALLEIYRKEYTYDARTPERYIGRTLAKVAICIVGNISQGIYLRCTDPWTLHRKDSCKSCNMHNNCTLRLFTIFFILFKKCKFTTTRRQNKARDDLGGGAWKVEWGEERWFSVLFLEQYMTYLSCRLAWKGERTGTKKTIYKNPSNLCVWRYKAITVF